jgi:hypothetical protein
MSKTPLDSPGPPTPRPRLPAGRLLVVVLACAATWTLRADPAAAELPPPVNGHIEPYSLDTGRLDNPAGQPASVFQQTLEVDPSVPWVRVLFSLAKLSGSSTLTITSLTDGSSQTLGAAELARWGNGSAYFNGPALTLELLAAPYSVGNRLQVSEILVGDTGGGPLPEAICGASDDRMPSPFPAVGRLLTASLGGGCTGFITDQPFDLADKCHLSAGHCFVSGVTFSQVSSVMQFDVPDSNADCTLNHPPADKQFPIRSFQALNDGIGDDWAVFEVHRNTTTGRSTFQEQVFPLPLAGSVPVSGDAVVVGYGVDGNLGGASGGCTCGGVVNGARNQTLQLAMGPILGAPGTQINHQVDTCGGNSGSPLLSLSSGEVIGIHTHAGCATGSNRGTQITLGAIQNALEECARLDIDHYKVYGVVDLPVAIPGVILRDQFGTRQVDLDALAFFATPVDKNGEGLVDPNAHQNWYPITGAGEERTFLVSNQLIPIPQNWRTGDPRFLVVPAAKGICAAPEASVGQLCATDDDCNSPPPKANGVCGYIPPEQNHFECYDVVAAPSSTTSVTLTDQFTSETTNVLQPALLCNPVEKTVAGQVFPMLYPDVHLACYWLPATPRNFTPNSVDQFAPVEPGYSLQTVQDELLCVPSTTATVQPVRATGGGEPVALACALLLIGATALGMRRGA